MPKICDENTIKDIARIYCTNGRNKTQALIEAGYSTSYAKTSRGLSIYRSKPVIDAINAFESQIVANSPYNAQRAEAELDDALRIAKEQNSPSAMVQAITGKCKLFALMTDKIQTEDVSDSPRPEDAISESEHKINAAKNIKLTG